VITNLDAMIIEEACHAANSLFLRNVLYRVQNEADEAIAFATHSIHDGNAVDVDVTNIHAELRRLLNRMRGLGSSNE